MPTTTPVDNRHPKPLTIEARRLEDKVTHHRRLGPHRAGRCRALRREGARVVVGARRIDRLEQLVAQIESEGSKALPVELDVTNENSVRDAAATTDRFGRLDGAFNNAGLIGSGKPLHETDSAQWRRVVEVT
jgi:NADP-dependent 3-hydroxy acid dehydrogenase YdfG